MENERVSSEAGGWVSDVSPPSRRMARRTGAVHRALLGATVLLVAAAPVLAFSLTVSGAAHTSLPSALQIGNGRVATTTIAPPTTVGSTTTTTTTTTTTVVPATTIKQTTVVAPIPSVSLEDDKGRRLDHLRRRVTTGAVAQPRSN